ncbi:MAG TPA: Stk1 family PASTA domain-containing Ser/Thr kinase [Actinomycetales bacterium]|nr:Stk1 family PASTA domain-containing Ser/Thr kinase [Actinomycetales bacterium]
MDTTLSDPLVGRVVDGRYSVTSRIARGGMATVYLATDTRLDREIALKVMHPHLADDEQFVARFHREAKSAARMSHPNVVAVYDQGSDGDTVYLAMEHVAGRTLREEMNGRGPMTAGEALTLLEPVLDALSAAHRAGVVHRDVKPENVLLTDDGRVKVADFGLARAASSSGTATTGMLIGTVAYLSPELVLRGVADARADVYAAGIMLFEMVTGRQPHQGEVPIQVAYQHVHADVPAPSSVCAGVPSEVDDLVLWCTARDPDDRPNDARELYHEVRQVRAKMPAADLDREPGPAVPSARNDDTVTIGGQTAVVGRQGGYTRGQHALALPVGDPEDDPDGAPTDDDWGYGPGGRRRRRGLVALVVTLLAAVGLGAAGWFFTAGPGAFTTTPDVVGEPVGPASDTIEAAGLGALVSERFDETVPAGQVVGTSPGPGEEIRKDGTVELFVSRGSEFVAVPEVTGQTLEAATQILDDTFLEIAEGEPVFDEEVPEGSVVTQTPAPGEELRRGEPVTVVLSQGRQPIDVPVVVGATRDEAAAAIEDAGLVFAEGDAVTSDTVPEGSVVSQAPEGGTLFRGDTVTVVVSLGPPLVVVPEVVGQQVGPATEALEAAGLEVEVEKVLGGFFGTVRDQDPDGGSEAPRGSVVTLTIV